MLKPLISFSNLSFAYKENPIFENISFDILEKDFLALIGPNGSGKTTLTKIILGQLKANQGKCRLHLPINKIGYTPQRHTTDKNFPGTVAEILHSVEKEIMEELGILDLLPQKFVKLSGGKQQLVLIALALKHNPKLLILDEPTAGVDIQNQQFFYNLLKKINQKGIAIILITHEVGMLSVLVKNVICINHKICCLASTEELPSMLKDIYGPNFSQHHHHD